MLIVCLKTIKYLISLFFNAFLALMCRSPSYFSTLELLSISLTLDVSSFLLGLLSIFHSSCICTISWFLRSNSCGCNCVGVWAQLSLSHHRPRLRLTLCIESPFSLNNIYMLHFFKPVNIERFCGLFFFSWLIIG